MKSAFVTLILASVLLTVACRPAAQPTPTPVDLGPIMDRLESIPTPAAVDLEPILNQLVAHGVALEAIPTPAPTPAPVDLGPILNRLESLERALAAIPTPGPTPMPVDLGSVMDRLDSIRETLEAQGAELVQTLCKVDHRLSGHRLIIFGLGELLDPDESSFTLEETLQAFWRIDTFGMLADQYNDSTWGKTVCVLRDDGTYELKR